MNLATLPAVSLNLPCGVCHNLRLNPSPWQSKDNRKSAKPPSCRLETHICASFGRSRIPNLLDQMCFSDLTYFQSLPMVLGLAGRGQSTQLSFPMTIQLSQSNRPQPLQRHEKTKERIGLQLKKDWGRRGHRERPKNKKKIAFGFILRVCQGPHCDFNLSERGSPPHGLDLFTELRFLCHWKKN